MLNVIVSNLHKLPSTIYPYCTSIRQSIQRLISPASILVVLTKRVVVVRDRSRTSTPQKHDDLTGCSVNLPLAPISGQICRVKNYQTNTNATATSVVYINPAGSVATTIDGRFYQLKLIPSASTGDLEAHANQAATLIYCAAESTWISVSDSF